MLVTSTIRPDENKYIYPPRAQTAIPREETGFFAELGWKAQLKYNDSRCLIKIKSNGTIELWNRHQEQFRNYTAPDSLVQQLHQIAKQLGCQSDSWSLLDGGLLDKKHAAIKNTIVIWDILVFNGQQLIGTTYNDRYQELYKISTLETWDYTHASHGPVPFGRKFTTDVFMPEYYTHDFLAGNQWSALWDIATKVNKPYTIGNDIKPVIEGIVIKDPNGVLGLGYQEKNNSEWMTRSRVKTGRHKF